MLEDEYGGFHLRNLGLHLAESETEALGMLLEGVAKRVSACSPQSVAKSAHTVSVTARVRLSCGFWVLLCEGYMVVT